MKLSLVTLSISALYGLLQVQAAPMARRNVIGNGLGSDAQLVNNNHVLNVLSDTKSQGHDSRDGASDNGVLDGVKILSDNHLLNLGSHTESKRGDNGVLDGVKILDDNHVLNILSHTESKRGDNGVLDGVKILDDNHLLNLGSHTESKRGDNGVLDGVKILDDNHVLNILSHTESKRATTDQDDTLLTKLLGDSTLANLVTDKSCGAILDAGTKDRLKTLVTELLAKDDTLKPVLGDLFETTVDLLAELKVDDVFDLTHLVSRDTIGSKLDTVLGLLHQLLDSANPDDEDKVTELVKIVTELVKSALCSAD